MVHRIHLAANQPHNSKAEQQHSMLSCARLHTYTGGSHALAHVMQAYDLCMPHGAPSTQLFDTAWNSTCQDMRYQRCHSEMFATSLNCSSSTITWPCGTPCTAARQCDSPTNLAEPCTCAPCCVTLCQKSPWNLPKDTDLECSL